MIEPSALTLARHSVALGVRGLRRGPISAALWRIWMPLDVDRVRELPWVAARILRAQPKRVLDIASPKLLASWLTARGLEVVATDVWAQEVEDWRRLTGGALTLETADATQLTYDDASFDAAYSASVIEHIPGAGDTAAMAELARVLKPGGLLALTFPFAREHYDEHVEHDLYGERYTGTPIFFQRHYSAASVGESSIYLTPGERLTVRDLLTAALIQSANDAAVALAEGVGKGDVDRFVGWMNARARRMGLRDTHFMNPDGLDEPGHDSSARDLLTLARAAMRKPIVRSIVARQHAEIAGGRTLTTWNDLLATYPGVYGVKTGHTDDAGWCEVAIARRDGAAVYAVILGSPGRATRNADLAELLTWGLDHYARMRLVKGRAVYASVSVPFVDDRVPLVAARPMRAVVRVDRPLVEKVVAPASVSAPVEEGARLGAVRVRQGGRVVASVPLVAARSVEEPSLARKVGWYAGRALDEAGDMLAGIFG